MHKKLFIILFLTNLIGVFFTAKVKANEDYTNFRVELPSIIVQNVPIKIKIIPVTDSQYFYLDRLSKIIVNGKETSTEIVDNEIIIPYVFNKKEELVITISDFDFRKKVSPIPLWMSILPPLIAIMMALIIREVYTALFIGILVGTTIIYYYKGSLLFVAIFQGLFTLIDTYVLDSMAEKGHLSIIIFTMLIGGMVNLISKNGGMKGVVNILSRYAKSAQSGQFVTWLLGIAIFFDDYANTLVVGNTMRPVTDRHRISREKLAYIVDSTAAPVAAIAFVTTWIGAELSYIQDGINTLGLNESAYNIFINSLGYSFYPIFALVFILLLIYNRVDYGPMYTAEIKAREKGNMTDLDEDLSDKIEELKVDEKINAKWFNAVIPVLVIIIGTFAGLIYTGWDPLVWNDPDLGFLKKLSAIIGNSDSNVSLLWSSISGVLAAVILTISQRILKLKEIIESIMNGFKTMLTAVLILILAWAIALVAEHMHTADFISQTMLSFSLSPYFLPSLTFILAALISFSTGSSWGTMAILYPLLLPAAWLISKDSGWNYSQSISIFYNVVSAVLAGSVLGDHCSPISDTTILSSLASNCNHIEHVRTQLPYALTVGGIAIFAGTLPSAFGISSWILFPIGILLMLVVIKIFGKKIKPVFIQN